MRAAWNWLKTPTEQAAVDRAIRDYKVRMHFRGPSLDGDGREGCRDICLRVSEGRTSPYAVRVRTERLRSP